MLVIWKKKFTDRKKYNNAVIPASSIISMVFDLFNIHGGIFFHNTLANLVPLYETYSRKMIFHRR